MLSTAPRGRTGGAGAQRGLAEIEVYSCVARKGRVGCGGDAVSGRDDDTGTGALWGEVQTLWSRESEVGIAWSRAGEAC